MKRFTFSWMIDGRIETARERLPSFKAAERRAAELAATIGVNVRAFWQGWTSLAENKKSA